MRALARPLALLVLVVAGACAGYTGTARSVSPAALANDPAWDLVRGVPVVIQESERDCGVAVVSMVAGYWGDGRAAEVAVAEVPAEGLTAGQIAELLEAGGLAAFVIEGRVADLVRETQSGRPVIVGVAKPYGDQVLLHYEVVVGVHGATGAVATIDPAAGWRQNSARGFAREWNASKNVTIVVGGRAGVGRRAGGSAEMKNRPSSR